MSKTNSALTAATTPLTGTEVVYLVQGGNSRKGTTASFYIPGGTDVAVLDGGTGASTAAGARTNLGLVIGTDVQAYSANLAAWSAVNPSAYLNSAGIAAAYQPLDSDLTAIAALTTTTFGRSLLTKTAAEDVRTTLSVGPYVATRAALKALDTTKDTVAQFDGSQWRFLAADYSTQVAADTSEGIYIKATAIAAASGAWVRSFDRHSAKFYGASASATKAANVTALQCAVNVAQLFVGELYLPELYPTNAAILVSNNLRLHGVSAFTSGITCDTGHAISIVPSTVIANNNTWYGLFNFSAISTDAGAFYGINYASTGSEYLSNWPLDGVYASGTAGGANFDSTGSTVGIFSCTFRRCWFANGLSILDGGDSITLLENTINGTGIGVFVNGLKTGARQLVIRNNNITARSECVYLLNVTGAIVDSNWMETPSYLGSYTGTTNALLFAQACPNTRISRNTIQPLTSVMVGLGQTAANYSIRLNTSGTGSSISDNDIAIGNTGHIQIGAGVSSTLIDWNNKFDVTAVITDAGTGTFGAGNTPGVFNQLVKFTTAAAFGSVVTYESTEAGAGNGPFIEGYRNSASPAVSDGGPVYGFYWNTSLGVKTLGAYFSGTLLDPVLGTFAAQINLVRKVAGADVTAFTIGTTFAVAAPTTFAQSITPLTNDAAALGSATVSWSDLFLATGGVINWANGNYTVTHTTGVLTFSGAVLSTGTGGVGYATGAGGAVTQLTSRTTGVTLNKASGGVTMFSAAGSATAATFTVTNSTVAATDTIILSQKSGTNLYNFIVTAVAAGSFNVTFFTTGGTATDAPVINYNVIKGVAA
ncbi:hypothetical protein [Mesorhizobium sp. URHB0026]